MQEYRWDAKISELLNEIKTVKSYLEVQEEKINEVGLPLLHKSSFSSNGEDAKVQLTLLEQAKPVAAPGKGKEKSKGFKNKNRKLVKFTPQEKQFQEINRNEIIKLKELLEGEEEDLNSASKINKKIEAALKQSSQVIGEASALLGNKVHHPPGYEAVVTKVLNEKQLLVPGLKMKPIVKIPEPVPIIYDFDARIERPSQKEYPSYAQRYFPEDNNPLLSTLDECKRAEDTIQRLLHTTLSPSSKLNAPALPRQRSYVMEDDRLLHPIHRNSNPEQISMFPSSSHKSSSKLPLIEDQNFNIKGSNDSAEKGDSFLKDIERITALIHQQEKTLQDSLLFEESRTPVPITNHKTTFIKENAFKTPEKLPPINLNSSSPPEDSLISGTTMKEENSTFSQKDSTSLSREIDELIARTMDLSKDMQLSVERELLSTKEKESTTPTKIITASPAQIKESGENTFTITLTIPATATTANITLPPFPTTPAVFAAQPTSQTPTQQTPTQSSLQPEKVNTEEEKALQNKTAERARPPPLQRSPSARAAAEFTAQIFQTVIPLAEKSKEAPTSDIPFSSQVDNIIEKDKENDLLKDIEKVRRRMSALERNIDKEPVNDTEKEPKDASGELSQPQVVPSSAELISNSVYNRNQSNPTSVQPNASSLPVTHNNNNNQAPNSLPSQQGPAGYVQNPPHLATDNSIHHNGLFPIALPNPATIHQLNQVVQPPITLSTPDPAKLYNNNPPVPLSPQPTTQHYIQTANGVFIPSPYPHNHAMGNAFFPIHQQMVPQNGNLSNHPGWPQVPPSHPQPPISRKDHQMQQSPRQDLTRKYSNKVLHSIPEKAVYQGSPTKGKLHKQFSKTQVLDPSLNDEKVPQSDKKKKRKNGVKKKRKKQSRVRKQKYIGQSLHDEDEEERESVAIKDTKASEMRKLHTKKLLEEREKRRREQSEDDMKYKIEHREDYSDLSDEDEEDEDPREYEEDEEGRYYYYEDEHDPDGYEEYDNRSTSSRSYSSSSMSRLVSVASGISMGSRLSVDEEDIEAKRQSSIDTYRALRQLRQQENERERMELYYAQNQVFR